MRRLAVDAGLALPSLPEDHRLRGVITSAIGASGVDEAPDAADLWRPSQFSLQKSKLYESLDETQQRAILARAARGLLEEAYFIEKSGMAYSAKMTLMAKTTEERMLYSAFAADEASHLMLVRDFLGGDPSGDGGPFLALLAEVIENGDRDSLVFIIQVVLEGWGLTHYRSIAHSAQNPLLQDALNRVLRDEARHHGSGMLLFDPDALSKKTRAYVVEVLVRFLGMVQAGPMSLVAAVDEVAGMTRTQRRRFLEEIEGEDHSRSRLRILRGLMIRAGALEIIDALDDHRAFRPWTVEECLC